MNNKYVAMVAKDIVRILGLDINVQYYSLTDVVYLDTTLMGPKYQEADVLSSILLHVYRKTGQDKTMAKLHDKFGGELLDVHGYNLQYGIVSVVETDTYVYEKYDVKVINDTIVSVFNVHDEHMLTWSEIRDLINPVNRIDASIFAGGIEGKKVTVHDKLDMKLVGYLFEHPQIIDLAETKKINAIKELRVATQCGLLEAKVAVDFCMECVFDYTAPCNK